MSQLFDDIMQGFIEIGEYEHNQNLIDAATAELEKSKDNVSAASFGGAFDVEDDMFFTREEIDEFGNDIADELSAEYRNKVTIGLSECYMTTASHLFCDFVVSSDSDDMECEADVNIDFRRIQKPGDLNKYKDDIKEQVRQDIDMFLKEEEF